MDALCAAAFVSLLCSKATAHTKNNSKNADVIASRAVLEAAKTTA